MINNVLLPAFHTTIQTNRNSTSGAQSSTALYSNSFHRLIKATDVSGRKKLFNLSGSTLGIIFLSAPSSSSSHIFHWPFSLLFESLSLLRHSCISSLRRSISSYNSLTDFVWPSWTWNIFTFSSKSFLALSLVFLYNCTAAWVVANFLLDYP